MKKVLLIILLLLFVSVNTYSATNYFDKDSTWYTPIPTSSLSLEDDSAAYVRGWIHSLNGGTNSALSYATNLRSRMNYGRPIWDGTGGTETTVIIDARDYVMLHNGSTWDTTTPCSVAASYCTFEAQTPDPPGATHHKPSDVTTDGSAFALMADTNDILYIGDTVFVNSLIFKLAEPLGDGYTLVVKYCSVNSNTATTCDTWTQVSNLIDDTVGFSDASCTTDCRLSFDEPTNEVMSTENNVGSRYWLQISTTSSITTVAKAYLVQFADGDGEAALRGWNILKILDGTKGPAQDAVGVVSTLPALPNDAVYPTSSHVLKINENIYYKNISGTWTAVSSSSVNSSCSSYPNSVNWDGAMSVLSEDDKWVYDFYQARKCPSNTLPYGYQSNATALAWHANTIRKRARTQAAALEETYTWDGSGIDPVEDLGGGVYSQYDGLGSVNLCSSSSNIHGNIKREDYDNAISEGSDGTFGHAVWFHTNGIGPSEGTLTYGRYPCLVPNTGTRDDSEFLPTSAKWMLPGHRIQLTSNYNCDSVSNVFSKALCKTLQKYGGIMRSITSGSRSFEVQSNYCGNPWTCSSSLWQNVTMPSPALPTDIWVEANWQVVKPVGTTSMCLSSAVCPNVISESTIPVPQTNFNIIDTPADHGGQLDLTWTVSVSSGITQQELFRSTVSGSSYSLVNTFNNNTTNSYTDSNLVNGTVYYYVLRVYNGTSYSAYSTEDSATPSVQITPGDPTTRTLVPRPKATRTLPTRGTVVRP